MPSIKNDEQVLFQFDNRKIRDDPKSFKKYLFHFERGQSITLGLMHYNVK